MTTNNEEFSQSTITRVAGAVAVFTEVLGGLSGDAQMPMQQIRLLLSLYVHGELLQTDLGKYTGVRGSAISRNLSKLGGTSKEVAAGKTLGLLTAGPTEEDRRFHTAKLTAKGRHVIEAAAAKAALFDPR